VSHEIEREQLLTGYAGRLSITMAFGWLVLLVGREAMAPLLPTIISKLGISPSLAGLALSAMWGIYSLSQFPGGRLSDDLSRKTVLVVSLGIAVLGFVTLLSTVSYPQFLLAVVLVGTGAGAYFPTTRGLLTDLYDERRGEAFGIQVAAGSIGSALAAGVVTAALATSTWQMTFLPVMVALAGIAILLHYWVREPYVVERTSINVRDLLGRLVASEDAPVVIVIYTLFAFTWQGLISFFPAFLQFEKEISPEGAALGFAAFYVIAMLISPIAGSLSDRLSRLEVALGSLAISSVGLLALLWSSSLLLIAVAVVTFATGIRSFPPVMQAFLLDMFPEESMAGDYGGAKAIYSGIGSLGPFYVGVIAERTSYTVAFAGFLPCLIVAIILLAVATSEN